MATAAKKAAPPTKAAPSRRTSFGGGTSERGLDPPPRNPSPLQSRNPSPPQTRASAPIQPVRNISPSQTTRNLAVAQTRRPSPNNGKAPPPAKARPTGSGRLSFSRESLHVALPKQASAPDLMTSPPRVPTPRQTEVFNMASPDEDTSLGAASDGEGLEMEPAMESSPSLVYVSPSVRRGGATTPAGASCCLGDRLALASEEPDDDTAGDEISSVEKPPSSASSIGSPCRTSLGSTQTSWDMLNPAHERRIEEIVRTKLNQEVEEHVSSKMEPLLSTWIASEVKDVVKAEVRKLFDEDVQKLRKDVTNQQSSFENLMRDEVKLMRRSLQADNAVTLAERPAEGPVASAGEDRRAEARLEGELAELRREKLKWQEDSAKCAANVDAMTDKIAEIEKSMLSSDSALKDTLKDLTSRCAALESGDNNENQRIGELQNAVSCLWSKAERYERCTTQLPILEKQVGENKDMLDRITSHSADDLSRATQNVMHLTDQCAGLNERLMQVQNSVISNVSRLDGTDKKLADALEVVQHRSSEANARSVLVYYATANANALLDHKMTRINDEQLLSRAPDFYQFEFLDKRHMAFKRSGLCSDYSQQLPMDRIEEEHRLQLCNGVPAQREEIVEDPTDQDAWKKHWRIKSSDSHDAMEIARQQWQASGSARRDVEVVGLARQEIEIDAAEAQTASSSAEAAGLIFGQAQCGLCGNVRQTAPCSCSAL